jgi:hypothetical protein
MITHGALAPIDILHKNITVTYHRYHDDDEDDDDDEYNKPVWLSGLWATSPGARRHYYTDK